MIIVTGGAGFIGSNIVKALNNQGRTDVVVVDDLTNGTKFFNLRDCDIQDYVDKEDFLEKIISGKSAGKAVKAIFHQGACSTTTEWDGRYMMRNNYEYSKELLHYCQTRKIPFIYASSASVYGAGPVFKEDRRYEAPLNVYGYSKFLFDQYVRHMLPKAKAQIVGLRYFNVYGPRQALSNPYTGVCAIFSARIKNGNPPLIFEDGGQSRDFIHVSDIVRANLFVMEHAEADYGVFNVGTGRPTSIVEIARLLAPLYGKPAAQELTNKYRAGDIRHCYADPRALARLGFTAAVALPDGLRDLVEWGKQEQAEDRVAAAAGELEAHGLTKGSVNSP